MGQPAVKQTPRLLEAVLLSLLLAVPSSAFQVKLLGIQDLTYTHQRITLAAVEGLPLGECFASNLADYVAGVDFSENDEHLTGGTPNQLYDGSHHFDRKPQQDHAMAFRAGTMHFQAMLRGAENAFQRGSNETGIQLLGIALHALQDLFAHSNLIDDLKAAQQDAAIAEVLSGRGILPPGLKLMFYDPTHPDAGDRDDPMSTL